MKITAMLAKLHDPSTRTGTAWWCALAVTAYDVARHGMSLTSGAVLLTLAGLDVAARYLANPGDGPKAPPVPVAALA